MKLLKDKKVLLTPIIVLTVILIFGLTLIPTVSPTPKNLPIAFVNEDQGVNIPEQGNVFLSDTIESTLLTSTNETEENPMILWTVEKSTETVTKKMNNKEYYAAFIIPADFSEKQASLRTLNPAPAEIEVIVNQGMNPMAATMASQMLEGIIHSINQNVRTQILTRFKEQGVNLTTDQVSALVTPISTKVTSINEPGSNSMNGNAPVSLFQPLWMSSIAGAAILFFILDKIPLVNRKENVTVKLAQIVIGAILAILAGFGLTWFSDVLLGVSIPSFLDTAFFLSITYFSFFLMMTAVLAWIGIRGIILFVLTLFFGAPLLAMAPEFISSFYRDWIYSWLPMRFMIDGLRDLFFFNKTLSWSGPTSILVSLASVSIVLILASIFKPARNKSRKVRPNEDTIKLTSEK